MALTTVRSTGISSLPAISGANLTTLNASNISSGTLSTSRYVQGGITHAEIFRLTSSVTGEADPITDWGSVDGQQNQGRVGSGMSHSSGVFTFPATGIWRVEFSAYYYRGQADDQCRILIKNNSGTEIAKSIQSISTTNYYAHNYTSCMLDVTDVSNNNNKVTFEFEDVGASGGASSAKLQGTSSFTASQVVFTRLGDT